MLVDKRLVSAVFRRQLLVELAGYTEAVSSMYNLKLPLDILLDMVRVTTLARGVCGGLWPPLVKTYTDRPLPMGGDLIISIVSQRANVHLHS